MVCARMCVCACVFMCIQHCDHSHTTMNNNQPTTTTITKLPHSQYPTHLLPALPRPCLQLWYCIKHAAHLISRAHDQWINDRGQPGAPCPSPQQLLKQCCNRHILWGMQGSSAIAAAPWQCKGIETF